MIKLCPSLLNFCDTNPYYLLYSLFWCLECREFIDLSWGSSIVADFKMFFGVGSWLFTTFSFTFRNQNNWIRIRSTFDSNSVKVCTLTNLAIQII